uniref:ABC transporter G family member 15 isoform X3 n=1 Tax=Nicotiana tabacum TaxID=4097 RepID=A0A1S4DEB8_TOBAC|nr:PREDICTED: ABC transporter G family member 15-like isoform X3 [Nicotiana tabacum]
MEIEVASTAASGENCLDLEKGVALSENTVLSGIENAAYLVWEDVTVMLPKFGNGPTKRLLNGITGYAEPGRIMAIMGPSGSGKSTLLDSLAGRLSTNLVMNGNILLNGKKRRLDHGVFFYADSGFPCPTRRNPADHFLRCINSDFDDVTAALIGSQRINDIKESSGSLVYLPTAAECRVRLIQKYKCSKHRLRAKARVLELANIKDVVIKESGGSQATWLKQLCTLIKRSLKNMSRDFGYYWLRIIVYIILSICVGTVFYDVGTGHNAILARGACAGFISGFMTFMSIGGFPSFIEEMKIFSKERKSGHYGVGVFILSNFISSFPFLVVMSLCSAAITYNLVKFHPGFFHFLYAAIDLLSSIAVVESCMMLVACFVPNFTLGLVIGAGLLGTMMASAGFFRLIPDLPTVFWKYPVSYVNYMSWGLQGAYKNDLIGLEFEGIIPGDQTMKLKGEVIISSVLGFSVKHSKWWDLGVVIAILISYRLLFYIVLKLKERALPVLHTFYTKKTLQHLSKRPSFRKTPPPFPSKRHYNVHSLSSQEGLNSPLH